MDNDRLVERIERVLDLASDALIAVLSLVWRGLGGKQ